MSDWTVLEGDNHVRDHSDGWCCSCASETHARGIRDRHNAEVAALRAKLAAVLELLRPKNYRPYSINALNFSSDLWDLKNHLHARAVQIAEGE